MYTLLIIRRFDFFVNIPLYETEIKSISPIAGSENVIFNLRFFDNRSMEDFVKRFDIKISRGRSY